VIRVNGACIRTYLRALLRDHDDADDAFSMFAEWTCRGIGRFRNEGPVAAWALGVARNAARKVREEHRRHEPLREDDLARLVLERDYHLADDLELAALRLEAVRATLPDRDRALLGLRLDRRLPWNDIAELLASQGAPITSSALRKRFERIKVRMGLLARELGPFG
jgi:DNA-directed RNA polymerase specialized sigma24 family protein